MKHIHRALCAVLVLCLAVGLFSGLTPVRAEDRLTDGSYSYVELEAGQAYAISGYIPGVLSGTLSGEITLPVSFRGKPVTSVQALAFEGLSGVTRINVPGALSLADNALSNMPDLRQVLLMSGAQYTPKTFSDCPTLEMIYIEGQVSALYTSGDWKFRIYVEMAPEGDRYYYDRRVRQLSHTHYDPFTAQVQTEGDFSYVVYDGKATVMSAPQSGSVTIPDTLGGAPVCYLDDGLFSASEVTTITLPDTVEEIPNYFCKDCASLKQIDLSHIRWVGRYAFYNTTLTGLTLAEDCTYIGGYAFTGTALTDFSLPDTITEIGESAFSNLPNAKLQRLPASLVSLGRYAFFHTSIEDSTIPAGLRSIPRFAFSKALNGPVYLPEGLTSIGTGALEECIISVLDVPGTVEVLGPFTLNALKHNTTIILHPGTRRICTHAFAGLVLNSLTLPEGLEIIDPKAFYLCEIGSLTIPASVQVCKDAFQDSKIQLIRGSTPQVEMEVLETGIRYFDLNTGQEVRSTYEKTIDGVTYRIGSFYALLVDGSKARDAVTIPDEVDGRPVILVMEDAFKDNKYLTAIRLPDTLPEIGNRAFSGCSSLAELELPNNLRKIGDSAFENCKALTRVVLPDGLKQIGRFAFSRCTALTFMGIPSSVETIGGSAFYETSIPMVWLSPNFRYESNYGMEGMEDTLQSVVTYGTALVYQKGTPAEEYVHKLEALYGSMIFSYALPEGKELLITDTGVYEKLEGSLKLIYCPAVNKPDGGRAYVYQSIDGLPVTVIGEGAFRTTKPHGFNCVITLPDTIARIEANAFTNLRGCVTVLIPPSCTEIDPTAFEGFDGAEIDIYGEAGSYAETFAKEHGYLFSNKDPMPFVDVPADSWYYGAVDFVYFNTIMIGVDDTHFDPNGKVTRAMLAQVLYNLSARQAEAPSAGFTDVKPGAWYTPAVNWCKATGLFLGVSETQFGPDMPLTREMLVTVLWRYASAIGMRPNDSTDLTVFTDSGRISDYAKKPLSWAVATGLVAGVGNNRLAPQDTATRAEIATILTRLLTRRSPNAIQPLPMIAPAP